MEEMTRYNWDVSEAGDGSIMAWHTESAPYQVYIASESEIYANPNSTYLFAFIGYDGSCTETNVINNLKGLELDVFKLKVNGMTNKEISVHLDKPIKAINNALNRIRKKYNNL